ncbi:hypothetical protein CHARACLAT_021228 [Characodon lateralis]|uniref:Uncharacterized protein n=1 Tax=Characodon lateralis TaxID=208331 RepID=A0ABU7DBT1_9TELE|nr:hypothetical protein [Characodon lateralis]
MCSGPVTNAIIMAVSANMFLPDSRPAVPLPRFSRHLHTSEGADGEAGEVCVRPALHAQVRVQVEPHFCWTLVACSQALWPLTCFKDNCSFPPTEKCLFSDRIRVKFSFTTH